MDRIFPKTDIEEICTAVGSIPAEAKIGDLAGVSFKKGHHQGIYSATVYVE